MRRKDEKAPENIADELLRTLNESIQARTKTAQDLVNAERDREQELQALHGDIQAVALGLGEIVGRIDDISGRIVAIEKEQGLLREFYQIEAERTGRAIQDRIQRGEDLILQVGSEIAKARQTNETLTVALHSLVEQIGAMRGQK